MDRTKIKLANHRDLHLLLLLLCVGLPLHGSKAYRIDFDEAPLHDKRAFWSLQV